jgi:tetratricopeptide (TPR) repeat protein
MNTRFSAILAPLLVLGSVAPAQQASFQTPALLIEEEGAFQKVWLTAATKTSIRYRETEMATDTVDAKISDFKGLYLFEPAEFSEAMDLYQARKYEEAKAKFAIIKERFKPVQPLENSHAAQAAFYEMECMRRLGDLEGLAAALQKFIKGPLTREWQLRQLELYVIWDAVRTKSWERVDILAKERATARMPGDQRAQVAYCHGLALEALQRPEEALFAYSTAMTADFGASEEIARQSALRVLAIHMANPAVLNAIKVWGTEDENKNSKGYSDLQEAACVAAMFEATLGAGAPLPAEFKKLEKYRPQPGAAMAE